MRYTGDVPSVRSQEGRQRVPVATERLICPACGRTAKLVGGADVYPHRPDLAGNRFYVCPGGCSRVGCHGDTTRPLGLLATAATRQARRRAHAAFDSLWRAGGWSRREAYQRLAAHLGIPVDDCHIGRFDESHCARVVAWCAELAERVECPRCGGGGEVPDEAPASRAAVDRAWVPCPCCGGARAVPRAAAEAIGRDPGAYARARAEAAAEFQYDMRKGDR